MSGGVADLVELPGLEDVDELNFALGLAGELPVLKDRQEPYLRVWLHGTDAVADVIAVERDAHVVFVKDRHYT